MILNLQAECESQHHSFSTDILILLLYQITSVLL
jgi:hypothetical protein